MPIPRVLGRDAEGRQILELVPGPLAMDRTLGQDALARVGALVRRTHDAAAALPVPSTRDWPILLPSPWPPDLVCHNDLAPWNLVLGTAWTFIDWDGAGPSSRLWDLAYAAQTFALNDPDQELPDGDLRAALPAALPLRTAAMRDLLRRSAAKGVQPWATMHHEGHGAHWRAVTRYLELNVPAWAAALR